MATLKVRSNPSFKLFIVGLKLLPRDLIKRPHLLVEGMWGQFTRIINYHLQLVNTLIITGQETKSISPLMHSLKKASP